MLYRSGVIWSLFPIAFCHTKPLTEEGIPCFQSSIVFGWFFLKSKSESPSKQEKIGTEERDGSMQPDLSRARAVKHFRLGSFFRDEGGRLDARGAYIFSQRGRISVVQISPFWSISFWTSVTFWIFDCSLNAWVFFLFIWTVFWWTSSWKKTFAKNTALKTKLACDTSWG